MNGHRTQNSFDAVSIASSGSLLGSTSAQNARARTDVDDISDLIEDAQALSTKARSVVEAIIGGVYDKAGCGVPRIRIIDYYECSDIGPQEIIPSAMPEYTKDFQSRIEAMLELGRDKPFNYQKHFFPHDIGTREWGNGAKSRIQTVNQLGLPLKLIARGVAQNPEDRINAVRQILPMCEFHQSKRVMIGLTHLRRYAKKVNEKLGIYLGPNHNEHSHAADAFGEFAVNCGIKPPEPKPEKPKQIEPTATLWQIPPVEQGRSDRIKV